ncbi:MAG: hypothetical protein Q7I99_08285 [Acholeplasmataceae bacterium]|nr:hypothetical protein [Acholeplasmataceae bacterium]
MIKKLIILSLLLFTLSGCKPEGNIRLETPANLRYENFGLVFDAVENAEDYVIEINGVTYSTTNLQYDLNYFGDYQVRVKAQAKNYQDSYYTEKLTFTMAPFFPSPTNLNVINQILFWDSVPNATSYEVRVDNQVYTTTDTNLTLSLYGSLRKEIKVKAIFRLGESPYSLPIYVSTEVTILSTTTKNYSKQSTFDLEVKSFDNNPDVLSVTNYVGEEVALSNLIVSNQKVSFKSSFLTPLLVGVHVFTIDTNYGSHEVKINITDTARPYMISGSEIFTNFMTNVTVTYELFGGVILSLSGNDITTSDYTITGNSLTINKDYIHNQFVIVPSRTTLILGYTLESGENVVIGYIFIKSNE